jgi:hypothetical protein
MHMRKCGCVRERSRRSTHLQEDDESAQHPPREHGRCCEREEVDGAGDVPEPGHDRHGHAHLREPRVLCCV